MNLENCVPKDKHDTAAIERAHQIGFPALNPIIPDLLEWVQDENWPVARDSGLLLSNADLEIIPHIKAILNSDDVIWKLCTIELVLGEVSLNVLAELRDDLVRFVEHPTREDKLEEVDLAARRILARLKVPNSG